MNEKRLVIIDGNSLLNRAYYAIQRPMITSDGFHTQGIYGFLSMLFKIRKDYAPSHMTVAFDRKAPTFRHKEFTEYKAGRRSMPKELAEELPALKEILDALGIHRFELDGYEADDIIGTAAKMANDAGLTAFIITGDKDALQLAGGSVSVVITKKGISEFTLYDDAKMIEEYGFPHDLFVDYKALRGDPSDNIPGVPGVGEKTAGMLIRRFGSLENILKRVDEIEKESLRKKISENAASAYMSKRLATIVTNVPVDFSLEDTLIKETDVKRLVGIYKKLEFKTFLTKLLKEEAEKGPLQNKTQKSQKEDFSLKQDAPKARYIKEPKECEEALEKAFSRGSVTLDIISDGNHVALPLLKRIEVLSGGECFFSDAPGLTEILRKTLKGKKTRLSGHGLGRFYYFLFANGIDASGLKTAFDSDLARHILSPGGKKEELSDLIFNAFGVNIKEGGESAGIFEGEIVNENIPLKLKCIEELAKIQGKKIEEAGLSKVFKEIELPLCKVLAAMEAAGFTADKNYIKEYGKALKKDISLIEEEIYEEAGERFNINSPKQLGAILFEKLKLPSGKKTQRGFSTGAEVLEKLRPFYPIAGKILEYRALCKLNSTYAEGLLPLIGEDGKVHAHFIQTGAATGRISCNEPNLQNIPVRTELGRLIRKAFTAKDKEHVLISADYSQIELRVLAHMSGDKSLIEAFNEGRDIHKETAAKVFGVPFEEVTPLMRSNAKAVNFGVIYGMSSFGLSNELTISRKDAERFIDDYFERFPGVKRFLDSEVEFCKKNGYVTTICGRRRYIPEIHAEKYITRQLGERLAMNTPIQGSAADIIKLAMNKVYKALSDFPDSKLILQIHDELIIEAKKSEAEKVAKILRSSMEEAAKLLVKLDISLSMGENWYAL